MAAGRMVWDMLRGGDDPLKAARQLAASPSSQAVSAR